MKKIALFLLSFVFLCGYSRNFSSSFDSQASDELGVLLLGDQGKGNAGQRTVAEALQVFCKTNRCDFGLLLGDNFYNSGVRHVEDPKFQTHFEDMYSRLGIRFWAILGNHDYGFGLARGNVQAQIDYSQRSQFWSMPNRYYSFATHGIEFIAIDTVALPNDKQQQEWLEYKLKAPRNGFRIVFGHYPVHSGGEHGDTPYLREQLLPKLCNNIDMYVSGHDHHLEHLQSECGVSLVLSGAGAETRTVGSHPRSLFAASALGFAYLYKSGATGIVIRYVDSQQRELAEFKIQ